MSDVQSSHKTDTPESSRAHEAARAVQAGPLVAPLALLDEAQHAAGAIARSAAEGTLPARALSASSVLGLQRMAGNAAVVRLAQAPGLAVQRAVYKEGGKNAVAIPANAKSIKLWVTSKPSVQAGGSNHIADIQGRGFPGFKKGKEEYAGGRVFNNGAQPDGNKLPWTNGQTYQEWDINPCVVGQNRGGDRIITGSDGKVYFTNDHYANFTEFA